MSLKSDQQAEKLKQALAEMRQHKDQFSEVAFSQIVMLLLDKLRLSQTIPAEDKSTDDEIRLVTVMFIDVKDSTEMVQQLDTGDWKMIIAEAHEQIADVVAQWDGQIGQYLGDGVLCFFGAQRSRGDDAPHAVSCALQIQAVIENYAEKLKTLHDIEFGLRIGISTGRVVVGMIGSQSVKQELLALGPATNLAARLQSIAPVGGILIDSATYNRIRRDFVTQAQPPAELKGFETPVNSYLVLGRRTQSATQLTETHIASIEMPLVGRDEDLATLSYICDLALQNNRCEVITLIGDVGIGKSRLLQEAIHLTQGHFTHIIMSSQYEASSNSKNLLWNMLVTQCHLSEDMPLETAQARINAYVTDMWHHDDAPKAAKALTFLAGFNVDPPDDDPTEWALRWFEGVTSERAIILIVDNLQWTDSQSNALLERIAVRLKDKASAIIAAGRPEYKSIHPNYIQSYSHHTSIELTPLHPNATLSIIESVLSYVERVPQMVAAKINERVEGNPLFVREYLGMLFDNHVIKSTDGGHWRFNIIMLDVALNTLPNSLLGILQARIDDLPSDARHVLQVAAISGNVFWESSISNLIDTVNTSAMLRHLMLAGMVIKDEQSDIPNEQQYRFRHKLYRDVAYEMIPRARREELHERMAIWLLERIAGKTSQYPLLAEQLTQGQEYLAALHTYLEAVEVFINQKKEKQALHLIDTSLSITNKVARVEALPIVIGLWAYRAQALTELERYEEASAASQSALMLLDEVPKEQFVSNRITAERILGLAHLSLGRFTDAYDALTRAHNLLPTNAMGQIGSVLSAFGKLYYYQGRLDDSYAYQRRAFDSANRAQDLPLIITTLRRLGMVEVERANFVEALNSCEQALKFSQPLELLDEQARALFQMGIVHLVTLNYEKAYTYFSDAESINEKIGYRNILVQGYRAITLILLGRVTQGKALMLDAMNNQPRDIEHYQRLQLLNIASFAITEDYVQVRDRALTFVQQEQLNPILKARAQRWLGLASHHLNTSDALTHLRSALVNEERVAGRDLWLCYAMMADCLDNPDEQCSYYEKAAHTVIKHVHDLQERPTLMQGFLNDKYVKHVFKRAKIELESVIK